MQYKPNTTIDELRVNVEKFRDYIQCIHNNSDCTEVDRTLWNLMDAVEDALVELEPCILEYDVTVMIKVPVQIEAHGTTREDVIEHMVNEKAEELLEEKDIYDFEVRDYALNN